MIYWRGLHTMTCPEQIICEKRAYKEEKKVHNHAFGHLLFPLKGRLAIQTRNQSAVMDDRKLFFLPPGCEHVFAAQKDWTECLVVDLPVFLTPCLPRLDGNYGRVLEINQDWQALRSLILSESGKKYPAFSNLLHYSFHLLQEEWEPVSIQYLHAHCFEPISIEILAELEHFNVSYYTQWFKQKMHATPQQYLRSLRLNEAKRLLEETDYSLSYIAQAVGYRYQSYLTKIFQQSEKMSPLAYRINRRNKKH